MYIMLNVENSVSKMTLISIIIIRYVFSGMFTPAIC